MKHQTNHNPYSSTFGAAGDDMAQWLGAMGTQLGAARVGLFTRDGAQGDARLAHLWRADGGPVPQSPDLPAATLAQWGDTLQRQGLVTAANIAALPAPVRAALDGAGICSAAILPLTRDGALLGLLCFGEDGRYRDWGAEEAALRTLAERTAPLLAAHNALHRAQLAEQLLAAVQAIAPRTPALHSLCRLPGHDGLTGVYTRARGLELLGGILATGVAATFCYLDADGLDYVNDTYGRTEGDRLLTTLATVALAQCGAGDVFARLGGAGFMLVLPGGELDRAYDTIDRIKQQLETMSGSGGFSYALSFREGLCVIYPDREHELEAILRDTDTSAALLR